MRHDPSFSNRLGVELLDRYLAGDATAPEQAVVEARVAHDPRLATLLQMLREGILPSIVQEGHVAQAWARDRRKIFAPISARRVRATRSSGMYGMRPVAYAVAATLVAVVCFVGPVLWQPNAWPWEDVAEVNPEHVYRTAHGERGHIVFPDGSSAELAPGSRIEYGAGETLERRVALEGQALFRVVADPSRPFVVRTGDVSTQVLGTEFDVRRYTQDSAVQVAVVSGKVSSTLRAQSVLLRAGMIAVITDSTIATVDSEQQEEVRSVVGWTDGQLAFRNTPVSAVFSAFGRWSGYTFKITDTVIAQRRVTTVLRVDDPTEAIRMLRELLDVSMIFDGDIVTVRPIPTSLRKGGSRTANKKNDPLVTTPSMEVGK